MCIISHIISTSVDPCTRDQSTNTTVAARAASTTHARRLSGQAVAAVAGPAVAGP